MINLVLHAKLKIVTLVLNLINIVQNVNMVIIWIVISNANNVKKIVSNACLMEWVFA